MHSIYLRIAMAVLASATLSFSPVRADERSASCNSTYFSVFSDEHLIYIAAKSERKPPRSERSQTRCPRWCRCVPSFPPILP
jgi:hypothetical protein